MSSALGSGAKGGGSADAGGGAGQGASSSSANKGNKPFRINIPSFQSVADDQARTRPTAPTLPVRPPPSTAAPPQPSSAHARPPPPFTISRGARPPYQPGAPRPPSTQSAASGGGGGGGPSGGGQARQAGPSSENGQAPPPPIFNPSKGTNKIAVNRRQDGNPILKQIRNVPYEFVDGIVPDYVLGAYTCCLFISLRYHLLQRTYLFRRIKELRKDYRLRVVLCMVDVDDNVKPLHEINRMAILHDCTLILAWSYVEAARYLETFKAYETKSPESIMEKVNADYMARLSDALTTVRSINKTDVVTLTTAFGSVKGIMAASKEQLNQCPGLGEIKVQRLWDAFHEPFIRKAKTSSNTTATTTSRNIGASSSSATGGKKGGTDEDDDDHDDGVGVGAGGSQGLTTGMDPLEYGSGDEDAGLGPTLDEDDI